MITLNLENQTNPLTFQFSLSIKPWYFRKLDGTYSIIRLDSPAKISKCLRRSEE